MNGHTVQIWFALSHTTSISSKAKTSKITGSKPRRTKYEMCTTDK